MHVMARDIIGRNAVTLEQGQCLYHTVHAALLAGERVTIDFTGVEIYVSECANAAFGQLYRDIARTDLQERLTIVNMPPYAERLLRAVTANARRYYGKE